MPAKDKSIRRSEDKDFVITCVFDAPRGLVFKAFIDPKRIMHWWGLKGFTVIAAKMDLRPGGSYRIVMRDTRSCRARAHRQHS